MNVPRLLQTLTILILVTATISVVEKPSFGFQPYPESTALNAQEVATNQTITATVTVVNVTTSTALSAYNLTVTSTVTTSVFSNSDLTTTILSVVAVAALVIAVYALVKRPRSGPTGPFSGPAVSRVVVCPTCGTSNNPGAAFCRKCRTQLR